jgi:hypothetical protein
MIWSYGYGTNVVKGFSDAHQRSDELALLTGVCFFSRIVSNHHVLLVTKEIIMKMHRNTYLRLGVAAGVGAFIWAQAGLDAKAQTGNGAPSGTHYNLNILGKPKEKSADMTGDNGHRIFVNLEGKTRILLSEGADFTVLDANGTDGSASFQLPNPDPDSTGITNYSVWVRALGKPGGSGTMKTCGTTIDTTTGLLVEVCSMDTLNLARRKGKSTFIDVSRQLLYIYADVNGDGVVDRVPLFDESLLGYYWEYDNQGLKLVQLRFYPVSSNVN